MTTNDKLQHGDYVEGLTEEQARELLELDGSDYRPKYVTEAVEDGLAFDKYVNGLFLKWMCDQLKLHDFLTFKQKCINTFQL